MSFQALTLVAGPATEPISKATLKTHLAIHEDDTEHDGYLEDELIPGCREVIEEVAGLSLLEQTWEAAFDCWPSSGVFILPRPPLQSVSSISYTDKDGNAGTVSASSYVVDTRSFPGKVWLKSSADWPSVELQEGPSIVIRYVAGYASAGLVPHRVRRAILLLAGHYFENREDSVDTRRPNVETIPHGMRFLINTIRHWRRF